jgi:hypothetical protein
MPSQLIARAARRYSSGSRRQCEILAWHNATVGQIDTDIEAAGVPPHFIVIEFDRRGMGWNTGMCLRPDSAPDSFSPGPAVHLSLAPADTHTEDLLG